MKGLESYDLTINLYWKNRNLILSCYDVLNTVKFWHIFDTEKVEPIKFMLSH